LFIDAALIDAAFNDAAFTHCANWLQKGLAPEKKTQRRKASLENRLDLGKEVAEEPKRAERLTRPYLKEKSDPDGTRTRVPAVKGRCPRPLDDGASGLELETAEAATSKP
jgi:hypothetical protein